LASLLFYRYFEMNITDITIKNQNGFSLMELIVIVVIVGVLAYFAVANFSDSHSKLQYQSVLKKIISDVRYARELALTEGEESRVYFDQTNNRYYLKWDDGNYVQNPIGGGDFIVQLGEGEFSQVSITSSVFSSGWLEFDTKGTPSNAGTSFSDSQNLVTLNNAKSITITANTGFLQIEN